MATLGGVEGGGQVVYVDKLSKEIAKLGYEVDVFTRWDDPRMPKVVDCHNGVRVVYVKAGPVKHIPKEEILGYMDEFTRNMMKFIKKERLRYKLVHAHFFMSGMVASYLKRELGIPFIVTFHALGKVRRIHQKEMDRFSDERFNIEKRIMDEADMIVAECPQDKEDMLMHYRADVNKIVTIPCGYDPNEFYPINTHVSRLMLGLDPKEKTVLQLGRMVRRKGVDSVIQAFAKVLQRNPELKAKLVVVGGESDVPDRETTPEIGRLQDLAQALGVKDKVIFTGRRNRDQLKFYYNAADVFVSTPWYEPFGITPLEAMGCGTPVIGSDVGGIKFSVVDRKTGFLVPPKDADLLAERMERLLKDDKLRDSYKENSLARVREIFTWSFIARSMMTVYEKLIYSDSSKYQKIEEQAHTVLGNFRSLIQTARKAQDTMSYSIVDAAHAILRTLEEGGKVMIAGNGGSAADASHFAGELVGHYLLEMRNALPVLSLTSDTAVMTAVANDFSFEHVFSRQIEGLGEKGDIFIGISTSGNSRNIIQAMKKAREMGMKTIALLGKGGGKIAEFSDISLIVPSRNTQVIQELHTNIIHSLCQIIENDLFYTDFQSARPEGRKEILHVNYKNLLKKGGSSNAEK